MFIITSRGLKMKTSSIRFMILFVCFFAVAFAGCGGSSGGGNPAGADTTADNDSEIDTFATVTFDSEIKGISPATLRIELSDFGDLASTSTTISFGNTERELTRSASMSSQTKMVLVYNGIAAELNDGFTSLDFTNPLPEGTQVEVYDTNPDPRELVGTAVAGD